jgi:RNA polymerase sigma factor (sigma-70 family)
MQAALAGDAASYRSLLSELCPALRGYFLRRLGDGPSSDAEDLVQETLMALHTRRATYDTTLAFTPWLFGIARYKLMDHRRHASRGRFVVLDETDDSFAGDDGSAAIEARLDAGRLLDSLPGRSGHLVRHVKLEGRSVEEVSAQTGLSVSAVKVSLHRSLKRLGRRFGGAGPS